MKKLLFLLSGVVTLTACSEDAYNDVETTEESMYSANSFNPGDSVNITMMAQKRQGLLIFHRGIFGLTEGPILSRNSPHIYFGMVMLMVEVSLMLHIHLTH